MIKRSKYNKLYFNRFRPTYPKEIYDRIKSFTDRHGIQLELVVDIGCGSGQSTFQLSPLCQQVVGTDISPAQIECAQQSPDNKTISNVEFKVAPADQLPFPDGSVSMVTCGSAWHWFDPISVEPEVYRVLKSPGCLTVFGYTQPMLQDKKCDILFDTLFSITLKDYWHDNVKNFLSRVYNNTVTFSLPIIERHDVTVSNTITLDQLSGLIESWSGYNTYCKAHPNTTVLTDLIDQIKEILSGDTVDMVTPYYMYICKKN